MELLIAVLGALYMAAYVTVFSLCRAAARTAPVREEEEPS